MVEDAKTPRFESGRFLVYLRSTYQGLVLASAYFNNDRSEILFAASRISGSLRKFARYSARITSRTEALNPHLAQRIPGASTPSWKDNGSPPQPGQLRISGNFIGSNTSQHVYFARNTVSAYRLKARASEHIGQYRLGADTQTYG